MFFRISGSIQIILVDILGESCRLPAYTGAAITAERETELNGFYEDKK